jgi:ABC-type spermidine/putrescine transport system permease subunit I
MGAMASSVEKSRWWGVPFYLYIACLVILFSLVVLQSLNLPWGHLTFRGYRDVFSTSVYWRVFWNTLVIASVGATLTVGLSLVGALLVRRTPEQYWPALLFIVLVPLLTPTIVRTFGWVMALQPNGSLAGLTGGHIPFDRVLYHRAGLMIGLAHAFYPVSFFYIWTALRGLNRRQIDVAAMFGASAVRIFRSIVLPRLLPSLMAVWMFIFLLMTGAFVTPEILGGAGDVMIYRVIETRLNKFLDATLAASYAVIVALFLLLLLWVGERLFNLSRMLGGGVNGDAEKA